MTDGLFTYFISRNGINTLYRFASKSDQNTDVITEFINEAKLSTRCLEPINHLETHSIRLTLDYEEDIEFYRALYAKAPVLSPTTDLIQYAINNKLESINLHKHKEFLMSQKAFNANVRRSLSEANDKPHNWKGWKFLGNERKYLEEILGNGFRAGNDGSFTERFEFLFSSKHDQQYGIAFNSGTGTLHAILASLGVKSGDEVAVPALAPAMCGFAPAYLGAIPLFIDINPDTFLMDADDLRKKITSRTKAIMAVHLYGLMCDMSAIERIAHEFHIPVLEDCAQCFLATDDRGRISGTIGIAASWSLEASKHLCSGEGGIVCTNDEQIALAVRRFGGLGFKNLTAQAGKVRISRDNFQNPDWERHVSVGYNYRMSDLTAAVALAQTERMEEYIQLRMQMGNRYLEQLSQSSLLKPQAIPVGFKHSYYTFSANYVASEKDVPWETFRKKYIEHGGDGIYAAWKTLNHEPAFRDNGLGNGFVPISEKLQKTMMQFTTNQANKYEQDKQIEALIKTLEYFGDSTRSK